MRQLTDSEQEALRQARVVWLGEIDVVNKRMSESFEAGFTAGLDHAAAQLAALTAERDGLREALKDLLAWAHIQDHHSAQAVSIRGRAWAALNEPTNQIQLDNGEHE